MKTAINTALLLVTLSLPGLSLAIGWYVAHPVCVSSVTPAEGNGNA